MNEFIASLRQDLLGRRMFVPLAIVGLALVGAIAYTVLGGGGSSTTNPNASASPLPSVPPTLATPAPANPHQASAETTSGSTYQSGGATRDPFIPLAKPKEANGTTGGAKAGSAGGTAGSSTSTTGAGGKSTGGGSSGAGSGGSGSGTGSSGANGGSSPASPGSGSGGGSSEPTQPTHPSPSPKPKAKPKYRVALQFGVAPPPGQNPQLTPYTDLSRVTPLPSHENQLIAFAGVGSSGKGALFTLLQPAILKGNGACLPSAAQCESVDLPVGQTEELSFVNASGQTVVYLLQVVSIAKDEANAHEARAHGARAHSAISYGTHGATSHHRRRVARPRAHLHS
jgi:hypothetical protein